MGELLLPGKKVFWKLSGSFCQRLEVRERDSPFTGEINGETCAKRGTSGEEKKTCNRKG